MKLVAAAENDFGNTTSARRIRLHNNSVINWQFNISFLLTFVYKEIFTKLSAGEVRH